MTTHTIRKATAVGTLAAASLVSTSTALAEDPWSISANIGAVSNYIWRGVTQTGDQAAIQGGLDVGHESGFYIGTWASNIDWDEGSSEEVTGVGLGSPLYVDGQVVTDANGDVVYVTDVVGETSGASPDSPNYELDLYAGYDYAITDDLSVGVSGIYYAYPDGRESDFAEVGFSGSWKWFTLGAAYTVYGENDKGLFDDGDWYYYGSVEFSLPYDIGFGAHGGYYDFRYDDFDYVDPAGFAKTDSYDYWHYGASISKAAGDFGTFSLNWDQNSGSQKVGYDPDPKFWVSWVKEF